MAAARPDSPPDRGFFGHPAGMSSLFFTELWERFSYYGMRALLVLFLVDQVGENGGLGLDDRTATAIYGLYTAGVYIMGLPGGWLADRVLGAQRALLIGAILIAFGHLVLALPGGLSLFCAGLTLIVLGTGLLKPNIAALVAELYPEGGSRRDAGFTVFYMAINIGALFGPFVTAWLAQRHGWHVGFLAAAVGMIAGVAWFLATRRRLGDAGREPASRASDPVRLARDRRHAAIGVALLLGVLALCFAGVVPVSATLLQGGAIYVILLLSVAWFVYLLAFAGLDTHERGRVFTLLALFVASAVFWSGFEQAGSSLTLFAERFTDRVVGSFEIPTGWFQILNAAYIVVFAPLFSLLWVALARAGHDLSTPAKFALGLLGMGGGFLVMAAASKLVVDGGQVAPTWLVVTYLLHTWGELALSPVGMSATSQLVPRRFSGQSLGLWYASLALGSLVASRIAGEFDVNNIPAMPAQYMRIFWWGAITAAVLLALLPLFRRVQRA